MFNIPTNALDPSGEWWQLILLALLACGCAGKNTEQGGEAGGTEGIEQPQPPNNILAKTPVPTEPGLGGQIAPGVAGNVNSEGGIAEQGTNVTATITPPAKPRDWFRRRSEPLGGHTGTPRP